MHICDSLNLIIPFFLEFCLDATALLKINNMALSMEKLIHGNPSGIDNAVSTYGGAVVFASGKLNHIKYVLVAFSKVFCVTKQKQNLIYILF